MSYRIIITRRALKELEDLPTKFSKQISKAIDALSVNPRPFGCKKLKGEMDYMWRIRVGDYRVLYFIEDTLKIVEIRKIGDRKNIYS